MIGTMFAVGNFQVQLSALLSAVCSADTEAPQTSADKRIKINHFRLMTHTIHFIINFSYYCLTPQS
jgi:hypothetical protein